MSMSLKFHPFNEKRQMRVQRCYFAYFKAKKYVRWIIEKKLTIKSKVLIWKWLAGLLALPCDWAEKVKVSKWNCEFPNQPRYQRLSGDHTYQALRFFGVV